MSLPRILLLVCLLGISFPRLHAQTAEEEPFRLPHIPEVLATPEERAAYLSLHYWEHFDFTDMSLIGRPEVTEQAFVNFIGILPYTSCAQEAVDALFRHAAAGEKMLRHFISLSDKYLYEPNSPMHNEELYILVLRTLVNHPRLTETDKLRPRQRLKLAMKNRPGDTAADFTFVCRDGTHRRLSELKADYLLLYFNDPDCDDCRRVKEQLSASQPLNRLLASGRLKVLSVCVEGKTAVWEKTLFPTRWTDSYDEGQQLTRKRIYDLKAMPKLYLLDAQKRVILKDASVEQIEAWLKS